jgi:3,4-dihydroxy 2-butanone 4-phosphate synthase / GTP cyclohydrolase II
MADEPHLSCNERAETPFQTRFGAFRLVAYRIEGREHVALVPSGGDAALPLVRIQSSCLTGTTFGAVLCDCRQQLELSMQLVAEQKAGCVVYLAQEGRGHGLVEKVAQLEEMSRGLNTQDAARVRGLAPDVRSYEAARFILNDLFGDRPIRLLTNNPEKLHQLEQVGIQVAQRIAVEPDPEAGNRRYLEVKKYVLGHLLTKV